MKRTLSILLTIAMIISLIPAVFAADVPTMSTTVDKTEVQPGDTITLTLSIDKTITNLNNWEWAIYFDKTAYVKTSGELEPGCMSGTGTTGAVGDNVDILGKNAIRVSGLSTTGDPVTLNTGKIATVTFTATENITAENARIEVKTEALPDYDTLKDNDVKLTGNIIDVTVKSSEAKGYSVSMGADKQVASGQIVEIPVTIGNNDGKNAYNAYDMTFSFDPTILTLNMEATSIEGYRVIPGSGTVRIVRYGKAAELGDALTLNFTAAGQGQSAVKVTAAYVDTNTNAIELDAPAAIVLNGTTTITVNGYTVTLPDDFTRTDATGSVIEAGGNLTFVPKDPNYDYTVTVTVGGGETTTVSPDENGIYTVANVNGNVEVTSTKTPKTFTVTQGNDTTGAATATYQTDYTFKLTPVDGYVYKMAVTIGGKAYTGFTAQVNDDGTTTYTIPGADITGEIVINSNKQVKLPETYKVTFAGTGAGDATGESTVQEKANYTFTVAKQKNFEYTITATMGGKDVTITEGADNTYTIANVTGDLVITIEKKSTLTMEVAVSEYVQMDNKTVFLVTVTGTPEEGKAFAYGDNVMYKTTAYGENVYSWLVIVDKNEVFTVATAEANINQASATAEEVKQSYDVNETGVVDINDAQLTYDIYSGKYTDFEKVSVRKFLRADVNLDKAVNSTDAVAVVKNSK
ncbi:hypothetical protein LKD37_04655 [Oscillospiraceae bacterium CLA-AA-H272]|uniref:Dockerin domain-containing protein n=1 Tax=Brotocaccenecus cirricatena TaxID=3064195 RepID=A0AAE3AF60_9FIRM|nr:cohesin domain-containing protein [Brotocaccenecus cirricatena]MCC2128813.1 hypothetical protein [Brotocaccenecus cirricatena]